MSEGVVTVFHRIDSHGVLSYLQNPLCHMSTILGAAGWVGRVPPGLKEFFNLPFLVLKARHPAPPNALVSYS